MRFTVELGHVTAYCRATGEDVPAIGDDAPFAFPCCLRQQDPEHMRGLKQSGPAATIEGPGMAMVASDRLDYTGRVLVGSTYEVTESIGSSWTKTKASGEVLSFSEHVADWVDDAGDIVLRSTRVLVVVQ